MTLPTVELAVTLVGDKAAYKLNAPGFEIALYVYGDAYIDDVLHSDKSRLAFTTKDHIFVGITTPLEGEDAEEIGFPNQESSIMVSLTKQHGNTMVAIGICRKDIALNLSLNKHHTVLPSKLGDEEFDHLMTQFSAEALTELSFVSIGHDDA